MNVVREINKINEAELASGTAGSWHDEYKDSAYVYVGGLDFELTEGDVITIFSQYGEIMNIHMPRDKDTGKPKGFAFLMYEDQRSTILSVDNLNGAKVLERTLRVDHVKNYKQPRKKNEESGEWEDADEEGFNAKPELIKGDNGDSASSEDDDGLPPIDPEDPMYEYLVEQRREAKLQTKLTKKSGRSKKSRKRANETPEERTARKAKKKAKKEKEGNKHKHSKGVKGVEDLLRGFGSVPIGGNRSRSPRRSRTPPRKSYRSRSRTPPDSSRAVPR